MLSKVENSYYITRKRPFQPVGGFPSIQLDKVFDFSYKMTFGKVGEHRSHRSGGEHNRNSVELYVNTFNGKLAEFGIYNYFKGEGLVLREPDLEKWELGKWDTVDLLIYNKKINIKSTKFFGNLALYETKDWNEEGLYIPNIASDDGLYDYFALVRISPNTDELNNVIMEISREGNFEEKLNNHIKNIKWSYDVPGYMTHKTMKWIIKNQRILPKNSLLNGKIRMDAENYYIETGDLKDIRQLSAELRLLD